MASPQTIQPYNVTAYIDSSDKTSHNVGGFLYVGCLYSGYELRAGGTFDISAVIPAGSTITAANGQYIVHQHGSGAEGMTFNLSQIVRDDFNNAQFTWNIFKTGSNWGTAGCKNAVSDYTTTNQGSATMPNPVVDGNWISFGVIALLQDVLDNHSGLMNWILWASSVTVNQYVLFHSSYWSTASERPKLYLEWTEPVTGTNCKINIGDTFKDITEMKINIGDAWKVVSNVYINIGDTWKTVF